MTDEGKRTAILYTDGACIGNPGAGGWAAVIQVDGKEYELKGGEKHTTNNRMELTAAIEGLLALEGVDEVTLVSDSKYVLGMLGGWKAKANTDLIGALREAASKVGKLETVWVKGHAGDEYNERADALAEAEAKSQCGYVTTNPRQTSAEALLKIVARHVDDKTIEMIWRDVEVEFGDEVDTPAIMRLLSALGG